MAVAVETKRLSKGAALPAKIQPSTKSYRGRMAALWFELRAGRDVAKIVAAINRHGYERCKRATYYNWEAGLTDPPIEALPAIAKALGVTVAELFPSK